MFLFPLITPCPRVSPLLVVVLLLIGQLASAQTKLGKPNFIVIFTDDQGYGDLGCYGHPSIKTPNLDRMAQEGQRWTNFYVAANVCTPSRAGLMTGRLPVRTGMYSDTRRVLFPDSDDGLPQSENTIARLLKKQGYSTEAIGKWHLGHLPPYLPTSHGFDSYFGIPYSNDMDRIASVDPFQALMNPKVEYFNVPLMRDTTVVERPADQTTIVKRYTEEALSFINKNKQKPFFLYVAHSLPHVPLFASKKFLGTSARGLYGDVIEEIDWSTGQILDALRKAGLDKNTYVVFTSDNGPWAIFNENAGSAGLLYGAKGTSYEGGVRVPAIFWGPGRVKPATVLDMGSTLDLLPTLCGLAGAAVPADRVYDGQSLAPVLNGTGRSPRSDMFYYHGTRLFAVRKDNFKLYYYKNNPVGYPEKVEKLDTYTLYNLQHDPSERFDLAAKQPDKVHEIDALAKAHQASMVIAPSHLEKRIGMKTR